MRLQSLVRLAAQFLRKNTPLLLTAAGAAGVVGTAALAVKAHVAAEEDLYADRSENGPATTKRESVIRYVKVTWRYYIPAVVSGGVTIASIILVHTTHQKRYAALYGLYALAERSHKEIAEAVEEIADDETKRKVKDRVAEKICVNHDQDIVFNAVGGNTLCLDSFSGRPFLSDIETIRSTVNSFNEALLKYDYASLNEFYERLRLDRIDAGEEVGWNSDEILSVDFHSTLVEGVPALLLVFDNRPYFGYNNIHR